MAKGNQKGAPLKNMCTVGDVDPRVALVPHLPWAAERRPRNHVVPMGLSEIQNGEYRMCESVRTWKRRAKQDGRQKRRAGEEFLGNVNPG
jgi:hypothetical protein